MTMTPEEIRAFREYIETLAEAEIEEEDAEDV